ncbi:MAG TPA: aromatic ring-hydroxylating dioxygenase subunit alpha [Aestuariivirgaceae bacterium]|nr:aromatic ring-hydroxylating dioxygenase subunit alpha [Aestuariivirgaceae bacterium]
MTVAPIEADRTRAQSAAPEPVHELIGRQPPGHALLQPFYASPEIYRLDVEGMLMRHWTCVGHESSIPVPGDYFLFEFDAESVIIVRGRDNVVRALINVCRHRGSRICSEPKGHAKGGLLVCPYHAWVYTTEGRLRNARMMPESFEAAAHGLKQISLRVIEGLIFITFADSPLGLSQVEETIRSSLGAYGWGAAKVIHQETYSMSANWKLAIENQMECYHCGPSHPDYTRLHSQARPGVNQLTAAMEARTVDLGIRIPVRDQWALQALPDEEADYCARYAMWGDAVTASDDGKPAAPLMGRFTEYDGGTTFVYAGPLSFFLAYTDYGAIFRYTPRSVGETELHVTWLVREDAREGIDYDVERVTWLWRITAAADKQIVEQNQLGVESRFYRPGPYAVPIENSSRRFAEWVLHEIAPAT